jgi:hypothetical protein
MGGFRRPTPLNVDERCAKVRHMAFKLGSGETATIPIEQ